MTISTIKKPVFLLSALIFSLTFALFSPALEQNFVNWDDNDYVYNNKAIRALDIRFLNYMFLDGGPSNWHPLTMLSHAVDYALWGGNPAGHHLTSIIFHSLNSVILFFLLTKLLKAWGYDKRYALNPLTVSALAALFFSLHPLRVESVAWVSERKDVLCGFFYFSSLLIYLHYRERRDEGGKLLYLLSLAAFILALLSKPMAVTLPFVLLILDNFLEKKGAWKRWAVEKIPFFTMSLLIALITFYKQYEAGAVKMVDQVPLAARFSIAAKAYLICILKTLLPFNLGPLYPLPFRMSFWTLDYLAPILLVIFLTVGAYKSRKRYPALLALWLYFLITLLPVAGLVSIGGQLFADRYSYIPSLALTILISSSLLKLYCTIRQGTLKTAAAVSIVLLFLLLSHLTLDQVRVWKDSRALWTRGVRLYPDTGYIAYSQMGLVSMQETDYARAIREFSKAISIYEFPFAIFQRGLANLMIGNYFLAENDFNWLLKKHPSMLNDLRSVAKYLQKVKKFEAALFAYKKYLQVDPDNIESLKKIGSIYRSLHNEKEAALFFSRAALLEERN